MLGWGRCRIDERVDDSCMSIRGRSKSKHKHMHAAESSSENWIIPIIGLPAHCGGDLRHVNSITPNRCLSCGVYAHPYILPRKPHYLPPNLPSLYLDLEGVSLGRHGFISIIISLYVAPKKKTYLVDVHVLGASALSSYNLPKP